MRRLRGKALLQLLLAVGLLASGLTGCSRGGGQLPDGVYLPVEANQALTPAHGLRFDLAILQNQLHTLTLRGATQCFPATVVQAQMRAKRITQELVGGLLFDAANDIRLQRAQLNRLEQQLSAANDEGLCAPTAPASAKALAAESVQDRRALSQRLDQLLNSDNQFASGSYELNPKYLSRLAQAVTLLREHTDYQLLITGHTDGQGNETQNQHLSLQRAEQVARYLRVLGIPAQRLVVNALADSQPWLPDEMPHMRLVNRRVSIELLEAPLSANDLEANAS